MDWCRWTGSAANRFLSSAATQSSIPTRCSPRPRSDTIEVGIEGSYAALKPIIDRYGAQTSAIYFPYPSRLTQPAASLTNDAAMMVMEFDRTGLARAAAAAATGGEGRRKPATAPSAALVPAVPGLKPHRRLDESEHRFVTNNHRPQADLQLTTRLLEGLVPNGPTDPIAYYRRPLIGRFFRERINLGLRDDRRSPLRQGARGRLRRGRGAARHRRRRGYSDDGVRYPDALSDDPDFREVDPPSDEP